MPVTVFPPDLAWYEAEEQAVRDSYWAPAAGQVVIDAGCAMGNYTLPALLAGARVIAVDPDASATGRLAAIAAGHGAADRLTVVNAALYDGTPYPEAARAGIGASPWASLAPPLDAAWVTLDGIAAGLDRLDWVKLDVEGAELAVLSGGRTALARHCPRLLIEDHTRVYPFVAAMGSTAKCTALLEDLGYAVRQVPFDELRTFLVAEKAVV